MKRIITYGIIVLLILSALSGCTPKPHPEETLITFLDLRQSVTQFNYRLYFDDDVYEARDLYANIPEGNPMKTEEVESRMAVLFSQFTYEIKTVFVSKDGKSATITIEMITVDMNPIFALFIAKMISKATEIEKNGGTQEALVAMVPTLLLQAMAGAKIDKLSTIDVKMNYDEENKKWWIEGKETNLKLVDALLGGWISTLSEYQELFPAQ